MAPEPEPRPDTPPSRLVGIIGGMGPRATVDFYDKLVTLSDAGTDQEHVRVVMWADPTVPSRQEAVLAGGTDPTPWLRHGIDTLVTAGAEILVVPCNTVHHFLAGLVPDGVELLDIVDTTIAVLDGASGAATGLLATDALLTTGLFQRKLDQASHRVVLLDAAGQSALTALVEDVKAGTPPRTLLPRLEALVALLGEQGATTVVAACTELSSVLAETRRLGGCDLVDPSRELALATIRRSRSDTGPAAAHRPTNG